jgi:hypothetical protein
MYNLWVPNIYSRYLGQIRDSQSTSGANKGFVASRVPGRAPTSTPAFGQSSNGNDISWSAAYPIDAVFLLRYYGDLATVREHWPNLMLYMDGQLRVANGPNFDNSTSRVREFPLNWLFFSTNSMLCLLLGNGKQGLPDFYYWGDWCAVQPRANATPGTGPEAAAANFLMALRSMVEIGIAVGDHANAARYNTTWAKLVPLYERRFWNDTLQTWASDSMELQTLTALSLAAGVGSRADRASAVAALDRDVRARGNHLTVGSAGAKWLLRTLSQEGKHDTALQLAMQTTFPSWGWWITEGNASTCWESWSGVADPSHVSHPSHNHIFLCGGVGGWMYEFMAGIRPTSPGYRTVDIRPHISKTLGPSSMEAAVRTVRGTITSNWTRHTTAASAQGAGQTVLSLRVHVPAGVQRAILRIPLLGLAARDVRLQQLELRHHPSISADRAVLELWHASAAALPMPGSTVLTCKAVDGADPDGDAALELAVGAGVLQFAVLVL